MLKKKDTDSQGDRKQCLITFCLMDEEIHFKYKDSDRLKVKVWKKYTPLTIIKRKLL